MALKSAARGAQLSRASSPAWRALPGEYLSLTKPRIISLLLLVTLAGMLIAQGGLPSFRQIALTLTGGALMAGAANVLNCYRDRDLDRKMSRTRKRPLVTGTIAPGQALLFGIVLAAGSLLVLGIGVNPLSAVLAFSGLAVYVFLYTPWKRNSPGSVLIGSIAGAMPPLVGWASVARHLDVHAFLLFAIVAVWQVPHTHALSLLLYNDYSRAEVPVLPVARGVRSAQRQVFVYSILLLEVTLVPAMLGFSHWIYAAAALLLGGRFIQLAYAGMRGSRLRSDLSLYKFSLLYLALLFTAMAADRLIYGLS